MKHTKFSFKFLGGTIDVWAFNYEQAKILAQAKAIQNGWDYTLK